MVSPHNSGKSTLLYNIIGYNQNLPTDLKECTKTGIIIKYAKKEERQNNMREIKRRKKIYSGIKNNFKRT